MILQTLKNSLKTFLLKKNIRLSRTTDAVQLKNFFASIKPKTTSHGLIRVGGGTDGGYLVPNDLENISICFSPGVSEVADFEMDLANKGMKCFLADYSVEAPPIEHKLFDFEKKFLGPMEDAIYMTLENWVKRKAPNQSEFILQMDIEGAEYGVILDTSRETLKKFRILIIEFHGLDALCDKLGFELINLTFNKLLKDFEIVHIHPNNCSKPVSYKGYEIPPVLEFAFLRKDRTSNSSPTLTFPHPLDKPNVSYLEDFSLPKCWFET